MQRKLLDRESDNIEESATRSDTIDFCCFVSLPWTMDAVVTDCVLDQEFSANLATSFVDAVTHRQTRDATLLCYTNALFLF